jgi:hypothetical protein
MTSDHRGPTEARICDVLFHHILTAFLREYVVPAVNLWSYLDQRFQFKFRYWVDDD